LIAQKKSLIFFLLVMMGAEMALAVPGPFRLTIYSFPGSIEPQQHSSSSSYVFQNIFRNLYIYKGPGQLKTDMASSCRRKKQGLIFQCTLRSDLKWNNGEPIKAADFISTYQKILDPHSKAQKPELLFPVKNARAIFEGTSPLQSLGVKALSPTELQFELSEPDSEFEYNLSTFYLAPTKGSYEFPKGPKTASFFTNGPYQIKSWEIGQSLQLESNPNYPGPKDRPPVEFLNVTEESVILRLYEKNEIHFVRHLPTLLISKYRGRPDFYSIPALRFDYLAFGPELKESLEDRKALAHSLNFPELQTLLASVGRPGCPGIPSEWTEPPKPCIEQKIPPPAISELAKAKISKAPWVYSYSLQGGDDHRRTAEWLQEQWKKNLKIEVQVRGFENKMYVAQIKNNPTAIFRKGLSPERPTCSSVMENFTSDHPENFIHHKNSQFDQWVSEMRVAKDSHTKKKLCRKALDALLDSYLMIPTGPYHLSLLASTEFKGWQLNELNQLDLNELSPGSAK
jgi:oligopeptide transport system substrate-binding protein